MRNRGIRLGCCFRTVLFVFLLFPAASVALSAESVRVSVEGLGGETLQNVRAVLGVPPGIVRPDGTADAAWLERFVEGIPEKVAEALEPFGHYQPTVKTGLIRADNQYRVQVSVEAGPPVKVTSARVAIVGPGAEERALARLRSSFPLKAGDILRHQQYTRAKEQMRNTALDLGYLDADFPVHRAEVHRADRTAEIELTLDTGPRYSFDGITFSGAPGYPEKYLRRFLTFKSGDIFSYPRLSETQVNFYNSDRFSQVFLQADKERVRDGSVPVDIRLVPSHTKRLRLGVGYGTDTGPRVSGRYLDLNALDLGHEFEVGADVSQSLQALVSRYSVPIGSAAGGVFSLRLLVERQDLPTYETRSTSFELSREWQIRPNMLGAVFLRELYEWSVVGGERTSSLVQMPGARISGRSFDNPVRPRRGYRYFFEVRGTDPALGSDVNFFQFINETEVVLPLPGRFSIEARTKIGATAQTDSLQDIPVTLRFFAGGDRSVRGYSYQSLGPTNDAGDVVGGRNLLVGNIDLERAVGANWGVAAFYDAGNAFNSFGRIDLFQSAGLGVRYYSPVGPIRLDLARQIGVPNPGFRVHLTIGFGI